LEEIKADQELETSELKALSWSMVGKRGIAITSAV